MHTSTKWFIDIAFVIDATGSMTPIIDQVKERALTLGDEVARCYEEAGMPCEQLRVRVVDFADFASEGDETIRETDFFTLPEQRAEFEKAVRNIDIDGRGGDAPENALEGLYAAMMSDWVQPKPGERVRQIIVLITDAMPLFLHEREGYIGYGAYDFPANIEELERLWDPDMDLKERRTKLVRSARRLVLFAPQGYDGNGHSWEPVRKWRCVFPYEVEQAWGLAGVELGRIITAIICSSI